MLIWHTVRSDIWLEYESSKLDITQHSLFAVKIKADNWPRQKCIGQCHEFKNWKCRPIYRSPTAHHYLHVCWTKTKKDYQRVSSPKNENSVITHPHVVSNPWEHKLRYFWWNLRALRPSIDSKGPYMIKVQKRSNEIGKIISENTHWTENTYALLCQPHRALPRIFTL